MGNTSAKHQSSTSRPKKNVHWKTAETPSAPGKPVLVHTDISSTATTAATADSDAAADVVTLKWERPRTDGGSPLYGYYVEHRRTGSPQWVNSTPALILYPEVVLTGLEPGWRYQFRVCAENAVGTSVYSELSEPLTVALQRTGTGGGGGGSSAAPHFVDELPAATTVIENDKVEFHVRIAGQPVPLVNWYKDGFEVFSSRRTRIVTENGASTLIIHQTALTDEGEIKCTATNRHGHVVARGALHIEAPPKIRLPRQYEDGLLIEADEVVRLKVGLAGRPAPMVVWCHNGEIIRNEERNGGGHYEVQTTEKNSTLKIANSRRADRGEYNLRAINQLGDDVVSFLVTVTDRPSRPGKVTVSMSIGKSVTLAWQAPDDDGGCKIGNYVVEYFRLGWNVWLKAVTTRQLSATLNDLIEGSEYKFRVKAESPYGMSDPSEESDVMFVPDPKRGILNAASVSPARDAIVDGALGGEQVSRIPVLAKQAPVKAAATPTVATMKVPVKADKMPAANATRTKIAVPSKSTGGGSNKRVPSPKLYDSETLAREMSYGTANTSDTSGVPMAIGGHRPVLRAYDQQLLRDAQLDESSDEAAYDKQQRKNSLRRDIEAAMGPEKERNAGKPPASAEGSDEVHTSSEFVMVMKEEPVPENAKNGPADQPSYDPEFDSIPPPQLSHSTPELGTEHPVAPALRRCVSSTEMLYEKAMQRFYKAVELEEEDKSSKADRRSASIEPSKQSKPPQHDLPVITRRLGSFGEADLLERRNSLRKRVSTESLTLPAKLRDKQFDVEPAAAPAPSPTTPVPDQPSIAATDAADSHSIVSEDRDLKQEIRESQRRLSEQHANLTPSSSVEFEDDYTESTASSESMTSVDSMEKFKSVIRSISKEKSAEMDTYNPMMSSRTVATSSNVRTIHDSAIEQRSKDNQAAAPFDAPPLEPFDSEEMIRRSLESTEPEELLSEEDMEEPPLPARRQVDVPRSADDARALSPYRTPTPDQSTIALTRPLPLPSPDFVPKPILKRPSIDDAVPKEVADKPKTKPKKEKPEKAPKAEKSERKSSNGGGLLQMFKKSTGAAADKAEASPAATAAGITASITAVADAVTTKMSAAALAKKKSMERRQSSLEENKVAIDHYSDIVSTIGVTRRPKVPVYLSADELKRVAEREAAAAAQEEAAQQSRDSSTGTLSTHSSVSLASSQKLSPKPPLKRNSSTELKIAAASAAAAATLKESNKRSLFASKLSKDPKKVPLEALPKPPLEFSRSVSVDEDAVASVEATATPPEAGSSATKRGRTPSTGTTPAAGANTRSASGTRSRSSSVLRKGSSRDSSQTRASTAAAAPQPAVSPPAARSSSRTRTPSRTRQPQSQSKSPSGRKRTSLHVARIGIDDEQHRGGRQRGSGASGSRSPEPAMRSQTPEQLLDEAEKTVRSTMAYAMDLSLLLVACWLYVFKNVWLVLPVLALLVYRQVSSAVADKIPKWMKRKRSAKKAEEEEEEEENEEE